jgi:hypothetical protein
VCVGGWGVDSVTEHDPELFFRLLLAGEILPLPFLPYRRVKIQGRGRVRIQVHV